MESRVMQQLVLILLTLFADIHTHSACPARCRCQGRNQALYIDCRDQGLKDLPKDLPNNTYDLNISDNQGIHIENLEHFNMVSLSAANVSLKSAIILPRRISYLALESNHLHYKDITQMFYSLMPSLITLRLYNNSIVIPNSSQSILQNTPNLIYLHLSLNVIPIVNSQLFASLSQLRGLYLSKCKVHTISPHAFDNLPKLSQIELIGNRLRQLPTDIFYRNTVLKVLSCVDNRLTKFPLVNHSLIILDLAGNAFEHVESLFDATALFLRNNSLREIPKSFRQRMPKMLTMDLSWNLIIKIEERSFAANIYLKTVDLSNNRITYIHSKAFTPLKGLQSLYLASNQIKHLHPGLFIGLNIRALLLHDNKLSEVNNFFKGVPKLLQLVTLFTNNITSITDKLVAGLNPSTKFYLSCNNITVVNTSSQSRVNVMCATAQPVVIEKISFTIGFSFRKKGFECPFRGWFRYTECTACKVGHYNHGNDECQSCARGGYYQDELAQSKCKNCNLGQFVNHTGGSSKLDCQACPQGTETKRYANTRACYCLPGHCRVNRFDRCEESNDRGILCRNDTARLRPDYWWLWTNETDKAKYLCFQKNMMIDGELYNRSCITFYSKLPKVYRCRFNGACLGGNQAKCHDNYTGPLCAVCNRYYYRSYLGCVKCQSKTVSILKLLALPCFIVITFLILLWADKKQINETDGRSLGDVLSSCAKIFLSHYQLLGVIMRLLSEIEWPKMLVTLALACYQVTLEVFSFPALKCLHPSLEVAAFTEMLIAVGTSVSIPILIVLALCVHLYVIRKERLNTYSNRIEKLAGLYLRYLLLFLFIVYPFMCQRIFQVMPFACHKVCYDHDGKFCKDFLRVDYREQCASSDPSKAIYVTISYMACILPIGIPLALLIMLRYSAVKLRGDQYSRPEESVVCIATRFCYESYKASCWYWEVLEMLRKLLFTVAFAFFGMDTRTSLAWMIIISGTFTVAFAYVKPIRYNGEHWIQMTSLSALLITLCVGVVLRVSERHINTIHRHLK